MPGYLPSDAPASSFRKLPNARRISSQLSVDALTVDAQHGITYLVATCNDVRRWSYSSAEIEEMWQALPDEKQRRPCGLYELLSVLEGTQLHSHEYYELLCVLEGTVNERLENECLSLQRGDAVLLDKNIRHAEQYVDNASCLFFCMDDQCVRNLLANDSPFSEGQSVMHFLMSDLSRDSRTGKTYGYFAAMPTEARLLPIEEVANAIIEEMITKRPGYWLLIQGYLRRILGLLETPDIYRTAPVYKIIGGRNKLASEIQLQIEARQGMISKHELAALMNYNTAYLCNFIKQNFGKSYTEYCLSVRLRCAAQMLRTTQWSVTAICDKLGFTNRTYFYKAFKKAYHTTPGNYREGTQ